MNLLSRVKIHQALPSQFTLLTQFFIGKVPLKGQDSRVLMLVNLTPGCSKMGQPAAIENKQHKILNWFKTSLVKPHKQKKIVKVIFLRLAMKTSQNEVYTKLKLEISDSYNGQCSRFVLPKTIFLLEEPQSIIYRSNLVSFLKVYNYV